MRVQIARKDGFGRGLPMCNHLPATVPLDRFQTGGGRFSSGVCGVGAHGLNADGDFGQTARHGAAENLMHTAPTEATEKKKPRRVELAPTGFRPSMRRGCRRSAGRGRTALLPGRTPASALFCYQPDQAATFFRLVGEIVELLNGQRSGRGR